MQLLLILFKMVCLCLNSGRWGNVRSPHLHTQTHRQRHTHSHSDSHSGSVSVSQLQTANSINASRSARACAWRSLARSMLRSTNEQRIRRGKLQSQFAVSFLSQHLYLCFANFRSLKLARLVNYFTLAFTICRS